MDPAVDSSQLVDISAQVNSDWKSSQLVNILTWIFIDSDNLFGLQVQWQGSAVHRALQVLEGEVASRQLVR